MPLALILSSFVAASRIGGAAQQYVLAAHKIDPVLAPTVMFGRTPARGGRGEVTSPLPPRAGVRPNMTVGARTGSILCAASTYCWAAPPIRLAATKEERIRARGTNRP